MKNFGEKIENTDSEGYHETKKHTESYFPYNVYPCTIPLDFAFVPLHWQDTMEIIYVKRGGGMAQVGLQSFEVNGGDIIFVPPGCLHGLKRLSQRRMEYENIIFDLNFLGNMNMDVCSQKYFQPLQNHQMALPQVLTPGQPGYAQVAGCLDQADRLCDGRPYGFELGVRGLVLQMFGALFEYGYVHVLAEPNPEHLDKLKGVLDLIEHNYRSRLTVELASGACGYSASHFMRWFKQMTGVSFSRYVNDYRLSEAARLLRETSDTVLSISENTGFDNLSNFNRLFKAHFGITPTKYRRPFPSE